MSLPARSLSARVLTRLTSAEAEEVNPWLCDDLRIARLTVAHAARGDAVLCSPQVLASYAVLGLHPEKVWPAIRARRDALGSLCGPCCLEVSGAPPVPETGATGQALGALREIGLKIRMAREDKLPRHSSGEAAILHMAAPSIAALYFNSDAPSSVKTLGELKKLVYYSGAEPAVRALTLSALEARGPWPKEDGPATTVISVSVTGMMIDGNCCRRTVYYRIQRALGLGYWRHTRHANSWTDCPNCREKRRVGKCGKCGYKGEVKDADGKYTGEFTRSNVYEFEVQKFIAAPRCKEIRHPDWRTYAEYKEAAKRGEHPRLTEMPRKPPEAAPPPPKAPAPARREEPVRKTAQHQRTVVDTAITSDSTKAAQRVFEFCGLADIGLIAKIAIGIVAEAKFQGIEIEDAAKHIADSALRDQRNGTTLNAFYWRDLKWRSNGGRQQTSAAEERSEHNKRAILDGFAANARDRDVPDSS
jgi:hypothetical protein